MQSCMKVVGKKNGLKRPFGVKRTNMDPVMEPIFTKMILCPGVGILKMISCSDSGLLFEIFSRFSLPRMN